jgi:2-polyprenyl-3-methyl-5-hydroxy-6-metoxy-1,4-benzoquinol methylase
MPVERPANITPVVEAPTRKQIASHYLPQRWNYHYVRSKLATDPLYPGVIRALAGSHLPVLDLGCGIGLLAHVLSASGIHVPYLGLDNAATKIAHATQSAERAGLREARFETVDLSVAGTIRERRHHGSVVILDLLQFVPDAAQNRILEEAVAAVAAGGSLVIRTGLSGNNWRARCTRAVDALARAIGWMNAAPKRYPDRDWLLSFLDAAGLQTTMTPLWGYTPFYNWLIVAKRPPGALPQRP